VQDIFILEAGYEAPRLAPVLEALMPAPQTGDEALQVWQGRRMHPGGTAVCKGPCCRSPGGTGSIPGRLRHISSTGLNIMV